MLAIRCDMREAGSSAQWMPVMICFTRRAKVSLPSSNQATSWCSRRLADGGGSGPLQPHLFQRRRPGIGIDQHERGLLHPGADAARPDIVVDRAIPDALVHQALDLVQHGLPLGMIRLHGLLLEQ